MNQDSSDRGEPNPEPAAPTVAAAAGGHGEAVAQPHSGQEGGAIIDAEARAAAVSTARHPLGVPGKRFDRRSPFMIGMAAAAGVAVTYGAVQAILAVEEVLVLIVVALFLAIGMEPVVSWLIRPWFPRWAAVTTVFAAGIGMVAGFLAAAIPPLINQGTALAHNAPDYIERLSRQYPFISDLDQRFGLHDRLQQALGSDSSTLINGVLDAGLAVFGVLSSTVIVAVLTAYFMANFTQVRAWIYRLFPHSRRPRAILIGDEIFTKVGGYILGNLLISAITAVLTFIWLLVFDVPYPLLLAVLVAFLDLIPIIGSTLAGIIVALVALTVSVPVTLATVVFFIALRLIEDYLLVPRIIGRAVRVPALVTVVAVLLGGALWGILGALLAIPVAAAGLLIVEETVLPPSTAQPTSRCHITPAIRRPRSRSGIAVPHQNQKTEPIGELTAKLHHGAVRAALRGPGVRRSPQNTEPWHRIRVQGVCVSAANSHPVQAVPDPTR